MQTNTLADRGMDTGDASCYLKTHKKEPSLPKKKKNYSYILVICYAINTQCI